MTKSPVASSCQTLLRDGLGSFGGRPAWLVLFDGERKISKDYLPISFASDTTWMYMTRDRRYSTIPTLPPVHLLLILYHPSIYAWAKHELAGVFVIRSPLDAHDQSAAEHWRFVDWAIGILASVERPSSEWWRT
jgi:hypothetical protein